MIAPLAFLDMLGGPEIMLIMVVVLIFFGGEKMPGFAKGLGKAIRELKKAASDVENEFKRAIDESERHPVAPPKVSPVPRRPEIQAAAPISVPPETPALPAAPPAPQTPEPPPRLPDNHYDDSVE